MPVAYFLGVCEAGALWKEPGRHGTPGRGPGRSEGRPRRGPGPRLRWSRSQGTGHFWGSEWKAQAEPAGGVSTAVGVAPGARARLPSPTMQDRGGHSGPPPHAVVLRPGLDQHGHVDPVASSTYSSPLDPGAPISPRPVGVWLGNSQPLSGSGGMQGGRWGLIPVPVAPARRSRPPIGPLLLRCIFSGSDRPFQG